NFFQGRWIQNRLNATHSREAGVEILRQFAVGSAKDHVNSTLLSDPSPDPMGLLCSVGWHVLAGCSASGRRLQKDASWA
ncbi:MAG: hypothetical protein Q4P24_16460, partial [Rhodobacterales bacterium]|nr:hypothetical protein [Rhodobacterales bacterium]